VNNAIELNDVTWRAGKSFELKNISEFGADAFLRFWSSTRAVADAFESAFGVEVGEWMTAWVDSVSGTIEPGPGLPRSASSGSVFALGLLAGIAFLRNRRRRLA
jgi:hypothetical protein